MIETGSSILYFILGNKPLSFLQVVRQISFIHRILISDSMCNNDGKLFLSYIGPFVTEGLMKMPT